MSSNELFQKYAIIDGDGVTCIDFSEIPAKYYVDFFNILPANCLKKVTDLSLNCEKRRQFEENYPEDTSFTFTPEISNSIAIRYRNEYPKTIAEFLIQLFNKTKKLKSLTLSSLDLDHDTLKSIISEIKKCKTLEKLVLVDLQLQDDGVKELCASTHQGLMKIEIIQCDVTRKSINYIRQYLDQNKIEAFHITGNNFDEESNLELQKAVQDSQSRFYVSRDIDLDDDQEELRRENKQLRERIRAIREISNPFQYANNVFVIGPGSKAFCNHLLDISKKQDEIARAEEEEYEEESDVE
ncbi:hypothetical protein M9Y10_034260 [Tritrichomonas musculus]|uniref:Uncharacterized protein n=1 Tax=Tritrichomonas musculus TaxID=1915356 RepID=A0ABR2KEH5_9EUKA